MLAIIYYSYRYNISIDTYIDTLIISIIYSDILDIR